jgi:hypothetical protein
MLPGAFIPDYVDSFHSIKCFGKIKKRNSICSKVWCKFAHQTEKAMSKESFKEELIAYKRNGGVMCFAYGDVRLPVIYQEDIDLITVKMPQEDVTLKVDYQLNFLDNLSYLQDKLLEKHPELIERNC